MKVLILAYYDDVKSVTVASNGRCVFIEMTDYACEYPENNRTTSMLLVCVKTIVERRMI